MNENDSATGNMPPMLPWTLPQPSDRRERDLASGKGSAAVLKEIFFFFFFFHFKTFVYGLWFVACGRPRQF